MSRAFSIVSLIFLAAGTSAVAQSPNVPAAERKGFATLNDSSLRTDLTYISSDRLAGRMSLQPGDDLTVQWIAGQFGKAGLDPIVIKDNGMPTYEQAFEIVEYRPDREASTVTLTRADRPTVWHAPQAFGAYKQAVDITAPVVFAGYGITAPELGYDDYRGLDAKGKIVFVFDHEPQEDDPQSVFNGTGNTRYATTRVKLMNAQAHGAVALVVVAEPNRKHLTNAERAARIGGSTARSTPLPLQAIADDEVSIPAITVLDDVAKALLATIGPTPSVLQARIDKDLQPQSRSLPDTTLTLHLRNSSEQTGKTSNVVGLLKGSDPTLRAETIIISAHHDHDGSAPCAADKSGVDQAGQPTAAGADCVQVWHGADDNGSGTVGVVALARAFAANSVRPKRSILFVVFAAEERGLLGSYYMAAHPLRPLETTRAMINFDMIGRDEKPSPQTDGLIDIPADTSNRLNLIGAPYSPEYNRIVHQEDNSIGLTLDDRFDRDSALNVFFRSDQFPFVLHNVPAFWWFTGFHPDYHHITDTAEKIDYAKMNKILQLAYLTTWRFGNDATTPLFVSNPAPPPPGAVAAEAPKREAPKAPAPVPAKAVEAAAPPPAAQPAAPQPAVVAAPPPAPAPAPAAAEAPAIKVVETPAAPVAPPVVTPTAVVAPVPPAPAPATAVPSAETATTTTTPQPAAEPAEAAEPAAVSGPVRVTTPAYVAPVTKPAPGSSSPAAEVAPVGLKTTNGADGANPYGPPATAKGRPVKVPMPTIKATAPAVKAQPQDNSVIPVVIQPGTATDGGNPYKPTADTVSRPVAITPSGSAVQPPSGQKQPKTVPVSPVVMSPPMQTPVNSAPPPVTPVKMGGTTKPTEDPDQGPN